MRELLRGLGVGLLIALPASPLPAQQPGPAGICDPPGPQAQELAEYRRICYTTAQALLSVHPQVGMRVASGNPVLGSASPTGLRLGRQVRVDATASFDLAFMRLPNLLAIRPGSTAADAAEPVGIDARALRADLALGVFPGRNLSPTLVGVGSVDLLARGVWLPLRTFNARGFQHNAGAAGIGARIGLLREGFVAPGVSVSVMHHWMGRVRLGDVCPGVAGGPLLESCPGIGHSGELSFDYSGWSARALAGRRFGGIGAVVGGGYDSFGGTGLYRFRAPALPPVPTDRIFHSDSHELRDPRWSAFVNASQTRLLTTIAIEGGWMQGTAPLAGFETTGSNFNPRRGSFFGSIGGRVAF